ncbi:MAG: type II toxin-antitoxin system RelE/ParE family toxin [Cyclobacteriaceae bacterium]|nr:type II toxin-antitoxin system RelE/ParE family toxin [Cyclobacteriaceae bacterium]
MNYSVKTIPRFEKNLKKLSKKYPSLKSEYANLVNNLKENPELGTLIGHNCYKIRLAIASKGKGKSGGARVITYFIVADDSVYLLSIYDKSDKDNLTDKELRELLKHLPE